MGKFSLSTLAAGLSVMCANALAAPIALPAGPAFFEFRIQEQFSKSNDINNAANPGRGGIVEGIWGVMEITRLSVGTVQSPSGSQISGPGATIFTSGQNGGNQILAIYYGILNNPGTAPDTTQGGVLDFYWWDNNNQNISSPFSAADLARRGQGGSRSGNAEGAYQGVSCAANNNAGCYFLARFDFTSGADVNSQVNTMISPAGTQNFSSYLSVDSGVMGYWSAALDSDFFTLNPNNQRCGDPGVSCVSANDMRTAGDFTRLGAENWDIANTDIIGLGKTGTSTAFVVPEPTSLILLGLGVALIGVSRTERRARR